MHKLALCSLSLCNSIPCVFLESNYEPPVNHTTQLHQPFTIIIYISITMSSHDFLSHGDFVKKWFPLLPEEIHIEGAILLRVSIICWIITQDYSHSHLFPKEPCSDRQFSLKDRFLHTILEDEGYSFLVMGYHSQAGLCTLRTKSSPPAFTDAKNAKRIVIHLPGDLYKPNRAKHSPYIPEPNSCLCLAAQSSQISCWLSSLLVILVCENFEGLW